MSKNRSNADVSLRKHTFGAACLILQPLLLNVIGIPAMAYIIRRLGPEGYGQWTVATALVGTFTLLANPGLRTGFVRSVAQDSDGAQAALAEQLGLRMLLALLAGGFAIGLAVCFRYPSLILQCTAVAAAGLVFSVVAGAAVDLLQATQRFPAVAGVNFTAGLVLTVMSVVAVAVDSGPLGVAAAYALGPVVSAFFSLWLVRRHCFPVRVCWNLRRFGALLKQARVFAAQICIPVVGNQVEAVLLPKLAGVVQYGYFSAGTLLSTRLSIISEGLNTTFFPIITRCHREQPDATVRMVARYLLVALVLCVPVAVLATFLAGPIADLLFPGRSVACREVIRITIWTVPLGAIAGAMGYALNAVGRERYEARAMLNSTVCGVAVSAYLVWRFGLIGGCWSLIARYVVSVLFRLPGFFRTFSPVLGYLRLDRILACSAMMVLLMWLLAGQREAHVAACRHLLPVANTLPWTSILAETAAEAALGLAVYGAAVVLLGVVGTTELRSLLRRKSAVEAG